MALTLAQAYKHGNSYYRFLLIYFFSVNSSKISVDILFLTEITLITKKLHNLQNNQVMSNQDKDTCTPRVNQQSCMKSKFYILRCGILCHFAHNEQMDA